MSHVFGSIKMKDVLILKGLVAMGRLRHYGLINNKKRKLDQFVMPNCTDISETRLVQKLICIQRCTVDLFFFWCFNFIKNDLELKTLPTPITGIELRTDFYQPIKSLYIL